MQSGDLEGVSNALRAGFHAWARSNKKFLPLYLKTPAKTFQIVDAALTEMSAFRPGPFVTWWAINHNRFIKQHKQRDILAVHELMYHYLTAIARGRITLEPTQESEPGESVDQTDGLSPEAA